MKRFKIISTPTETLRKLPSHLAAVLQPQGCRCSARTGPGEPESVMTWKHGERQPAAREESQEPERTTRGGSCSTEVQDADRALRPGRTRAGAVPASQTLPSNSEGDPERSSPVLRQLAGHHSATRLDQKGRRKSGVGTCGRGRRQALHWSQQLPSAVLPAPPRHGLTRLAPELLSQPCPTSGPSEEGVRSVAAAGESSLSLTLMAGGAVHGDSTRAEAG